MWISTIVFRLINASRSDLNGVRSAGRSNSSGASGGYCWKQTYYCKYDFPSFILPWAVKAAQRVYGECAAHIYVHMCGYCSHPPQRKKSPRWWYKQHQKSIMLLKKTVPSSCTQKQLLPFHGEVFSSIRKRIFCPYKRLRLLSFGKKIFHNVAS